MKDHPKWNFEEFTTFLLLYASHADLDLSEEEEEMLKKKLEHIRKNDPFIYR